MRPPVGRLPAGRVAVDRRLSEAIAMEHRRQGHARETPCPDRRRIVVSSRLMDALSPLQAMISLIGSPKSISSRFWPGNLEPAGIEAKLVQQSRVDIGHVMTILDGVEAELVGRAMDDAPLDPAAGHPGREAERMMVAAVSPLRSRRPAELGRPDDDRIVQQPALFEIGQQTSDRPVDLGTLSGVVLP